MARPLSMDDPLIPATKLRKIVGDISDMTLWRWSKHRGFPSPTKIGRRRYWRQSEVTAWVEQHRQA